MPDVFGFSARDVERLRGMLAAFESGQLGGGSGRRSGHPLIPRQSLFGKCDAAINGTTDGNSAPGSGTFSVYMITSTGGTLDTGENVTAYNLSGQAASTGLWQQCKWDATSQRWLLDFEACT